MVAIRRAKGICRHPGCTTIIEAKEKGYCTQHKKPDYRTLLDRGKSVGSSKFYSSSAWQKTRKAYRTGHPFCEPCKRTRGITVAGTIVHHTTERQDLELAGKSPHDFQYLECVCFQCHQRELRARRHPRKCPFYWE